MTKKGGGIRKTRTSRQPLTRSEVMSRVRSVDTKPEMLVRRALWRAGLRYRLHDRNLPGKPDIVFKAKRVAIFVHGCFWHGHEGCPRHRIPKTRVDWWTAKITRNKERDEAAMKALEAMGWRVIVLWECELSEPGKLEDVARAIKNVPRVS
ncbi:MAG: DNA mismatch endonuclease Vsr [Acidithiobacillus ferriphilus]|uniref:very short patch repair endonuclease n=1 Tax=Acidithiobacillus ferriphilus TaxID=1689834 RepID=UPI00243108DC|nr:very short patch repair endonuclease [Acidithiobacillus ferriphilus]MBW9250305.1 DNA mismatch endonuclease Vsr [Acidithiobacillus ferriphilus]MBW9254364.1 DNA mismatch endonuclease Vsr [Acidithiobacillus ferriphilus]